MVVPERVGPDAGDEVEVAGAVLRDELRAGPGDQAGTDRGVNAEQRVGRGRRRGRGCRGHAALTAGGRMRVPAAGGPRTCPSPIPAAGAPPPVPGAAARRLAPLPAGPAPQPMRGPMSPPPTHR